MLVVDREPSTRPEPMNEGRELSSSLFSEAWATLRIFRMKFEMIVADSLPASQLSNLL